MSSYVEGVFARYKALVAQPSGVGISDVAIRSLADTVNEWAVANATSTIDGRVLHPNVNAVELLNAVQRNTGQGYITDPRVYRYIVPWANFEVDLLLCPLEEGDTISALVRGPNVAMIDQGEEVTVSGPQQVYGPYSITVSTDRGDSSWYIYRWQAILEVHSMPSIDVAPEELHLRLARLVEWMNRSNAMVPLWSSLDEAAALLTEATLWGGHEWCSTQEGKAWLGRAIRYYRLRQVGETVTDDSVTLIATDEQHTDIPALQAELLALKGEQERLQTSLNQAMETISDILLQEADNRGWCSEYDQVVTSINERLHALPVPAELRQRERDANITVAGWIRVPFSYNITVRVNRGDDETQIRERAQEHWDNNTPRARRMIDYIDSYSAEYEDDIEFIR